MRINRIAAAAAVVAAGALVLAGCSATPPKSDAVVEGKSLNVAWNQAFYAYNTSTSDGNATANANITYMTEDGFNYYDNNSKLVKNTSFGSYKKISDDPLTIKYTISDTAKWNDGTPVDASDMLLAWAANVSKFNNVKPVTDADGKVTNQAAVDAGVFFDSVNLGGALDEDVTKTPVISDDNKSLTLVYDKPYVDWEVNFAVGVPAHTTYDIAFPDEKLSATDAKKKVVDAIQSGDASVLGPLSKAWSHGYDYVDMPSDPHMYPASGPYVISDLKKDEYLTLTKNKNYKGSNKPHYAKITVRFIPDALAEVQALQNGEVSIINPQSTADILTALQGVKNTTTKSTSDSTYEHVDLTFNNKGPFDPKSYGGDAAKALAVRQAFLKVIPRQDIIDKLIKPLNPDAKLDNAQTLLPGFAGYDTIAAGNGSADYATVDVDGAKKLLEQAGVKTPVKVNFMYAKSNPRRQNEYQLIAASAKQAGFDVVDKGNDDWGSKLGDGTYDAVLFGWQSTSTAVTASQATFASGAGNNLNGYSNKAVDAAYTELSSTFDTTKQIDLLTTVEKNLWADAYGVTIFQFPGVTAWSKSIDNVSTAPLAPQYFWNFWKWQPAAK
ncbi:ABC transporter family substrate-binding protein [soil metagenome]